MKKSIYCLLICMFMVGCKKNVKTNHIAPNPLLELVGTYSGETHHFDQRVHTLSGGGVRVDIIDTIYYSLQMEITGATDSSLLIYFPFLADDTFNLHTNNLLNVSDTIGFRAPVGHSSNDKFFHLFFRNDSLLGDILYQTGPSPHHGTYKLKYQKN